MLVLNYAFVESMQQQDAIEDIVVVGAGLAGLATALGLHR
jgi:aspartate oxidase